MSKEYKIFNTVYDHRKWLKENNLFIPEENFARDLEKSMEYFAGILVGISYGHSNSLHMGGVMTSLCTEEDYKKFAILANDLRPGCFYFYYNQSVDGWEAVEE